MQVWASAITRVNGSDTIQCFLAINVCPPPDPPSPPPKKKKKERIGRCTLQTEPPFFFFLNEEGNILIKLHDSTLRRTHHGGFQRQLLFIIALWVTTAFSEGTQYITLLLPIREIQTTTVQLYCCTRPHWVT